MAESGDRRGWVKADLGPRDIAHYVADTVRDLIPLARTAGFRDLAYLLDLSLSEADYLAKSPDEPAD